MLLGQVAWSDGDREAAQDWYRQAIATLTGVGADREAAQVWFEIGTLAAQAGLVAESADAFRRAAVSTGLTARLPVINTPATSRRAPPARSSRPVPARDQHPARVVAAHHAVELAGRAAPRHQHPAGVLAAHHAGSGA